MAPLDSSAEQWNQAAARMPQSPPPVDLAEREELLAKRLRDLQLEVVARRRELASGSSPRLESAGSPRLDAAAGRDGRPDLLSRSMPGFHVGSGGALSARTVVNRDSFGHLSWREKETDQLGGRSLAQTALLHTDRQHDSVLGRLPNEPREDSHGLVSERPEDARGFGGPGDGAESFVGSLRRPHSTSPRFKEQHGSYDGHTVERHTVERHVSVPIMEKEMLRHPAYGSGARVVTMWDTNADLDFADFQTPRLSTPPILSSRERHDDVPGSDPVHIMTGREAQAVSSFAQNEGCFEKVPQRHYMPATIREDARDERRPDEAESSELDHSAVWMAGLRSSEEDDTSFEDPLVFGSGFKPKRQSSTASCGPWAASFHMGGQPSMKPDLPTRRFSSEFKSAKAEPKPEAKAEAKSEVKFEPRQPRPETKASPSAPHTHRERKQPAAPQTRPQASPQNGSSHTSQPGQPGTRVPLFQVPPQPTSPPGSGVRAQSCPRVGAQSGSQARSPRGAHGNGTASPQRPQGFQQGVRSPRNDSGGGASGGTAPSPQAPKAPGRSPSPPPPSSPPPTSGPPPQFGGSHRMGGTGAPSRGSRAGTAPQGQAQQGPRRTAPFTAGNKAAQAKLLETLKAEMSKLRRVRSPDDRKKHFLKLCFQWHPDKNPTNVQIATKGFQMLQEKKGWLLG